MRIFEFFILEGEKALLNILFRMLDLRGEKLITLVEIELMQYLRTDIINECILQYGICSLLRSSEN
jgi:hypothetical protein